MQRPVALGPTVPGVIGWLLPVETIGEALLFTTESKHSSYLLYLYSLLPPSLRLCVCHEIRQLCHENFLNQVKLFFACASILLIRRLAIFTFA